MKADRLSSRTGQSHSIGGFVGIAEHEGELAEFIPYLEAGRWTGVGRQSVWGKGEFSITTHPTAQAAFITIKKIHGILSNTPTIPWANGIGFESSWWARRCMFI